MKPVKLQVNTFGATWRDVVSFDAESDETSTEVMDAAGRIGSLDHRKRTKFRVIKDEIDATIGALPEVLTEWTHELGWKAVTFG